MAPGIHVLARIRLDSLAINNPHQYPAAPRSPSLTRASRVIAHPRLVTGIVARARDRPAAQMLSSRGDANAPSAPSQYRRMKTARCKFLWTRGVTAVQRHYRWQSGELRFCPPPGDPKQHAVRLNNHKLCCLPGVGLLFFAAGIATRAHDRSVEPTLSPRGGAGAPSAPGRPQ